MGKTIINGQIFSGSSDAAFNIQYDPRRTKLKATNMQAAIDEIDTAVNGMIITVPIAWILQADGSYINIIEFGDGIEIVENTTLDANLYGTDITEEQAYAFDELVTSIEVQDNRVVLTASEEPTVSFRLLVRGRINFDGSSVVLVKDLQSDVVSYDNSNSNLKATNLKDAVDELSSKLPSSTDGTTTYAFGVDDTGIYLESIEE